MKKCEHCGGRFEPRRATARYCSVLCRHRAYRQRARSEQPRHKLERALLTAIRELRSGRTVEAVMTARLAIDDYDYRAAKRKGRADQKKAKPRAAAAKSAARGRRKPPPLPKKRPATKGKATATAKKRAPKPPLPKKRPAAKGKASATSKKRAPKPPLPKKRPATKGKARAVRAAIHDPAEGAAELLARYEHVLDSGVVQQTELARQLGLSDGTRLSRWRHGGSLGQDHADELARLLDEYEWEIFAGDTLR